MRSELFGRNLEAASGDAFALQSSRMLRVALDGEVMARQGSMVAFQGQVDFEYQGSGGLGRMLKKAVTGEGVPLMRCRGKGDVFFANYAAEVHLIRLEGDALSISGQNILAFEPTLSWDIRRIEGASMFAGGLFNTILQGTGWAAITAHGTPVVLQTDAPTFVDAQAAIAWSADLQTSINRTMTAGALIGRGMASPSSWPSPGPGSWSSRPARARAWPRTAMAAEAAAASISTSDERAARGRRRSPADPPRGYTRTCVRSATEGGCIGMEVQIPGMQDIEKGSEVKVRKPGQGERGVWRVMGEVANSGPDDPAYDLTNVVSGRRRIFRASRLTVVRAARPPRR